MVKLVLKSCGCHFTEKELKRLSYAAGLEGALTFAWLRQEFSGCPVSFFARQLPWLHELTPAVLLAEFPKTKLYAAYREALLESGTDTEPTGLVFPWTGLGHMILHNTRFTPLGASFCWTSPDGGHTIHLNRFSPRKGVASFLDVLGEVWRLDL